MWDLSSFGLIIKITLEGRHSREHRSGLVSFQTLPSVALRCLVSRMVGYVDDETKKKRVVQECPI